MSHRAGPVSCISKPHNVENSATVSTRSPSLFSLNMSLIKVFLFVFKFFVVVVLRRSPSAAQAGVQWRDLGSLPWVQVFLLPWPPRVLDYRREPPHPASFPLFSFFKLYLFNFF